MSDSKDGAIQIIGSVLCCEPKYFDCRDVPGFLMWEFKDTFAYYELFLFPDDAAVGLKQSTAKGRVPIMDICVDYACVRLIGTNLVFYNDIDCERESLILRMDPDSNVTWVSVGSKEWLPR